ncbi:MAG: gliding motility lipoprotein GldH [Flavobacteriales bacterium]|nr:gliding motility lipoprotein GldH [Flavobacteriales bacterium]
MITFNRTTIVSLGLILGGCTGEVVFVADQAISASGWSSTDRPEFCFDISDTLVRHDVFIDVRHTGDYPFSDLYVFVDLDGPGNLHIRDTVECILADASGNWFGKGTGFVVTDAYRAHVLYKLGNRFPRKGRYCMRLEQAMRTDPLPEILDVGITIARSERTR